MGIYDWGDFGQNFDQESVRKQRPEQIFDDFANIQPTDYEQGTNYGFGQDEPAYSNFREDISSLPYAYDTGMKSWSSPVAENRLRQIGEQSAQPLTPDSEPFVARDFFNNLYHPESDASNRFNSLINQYPQREKQGVGRGIVAAMIAGKDPKASQEFLEYPHARQVADWKLQIEPAQKAADLERNTNINERQYAYQMTQAEIAKQKADETERNNRDRNDLLRMKQAGAEFDFSGPHVMRYKADGTLEDTGFATGKLSATDLYLLQQKGRMEVVGAQQAGADRRVVATGEQARETKGAPSGSSGSNYQDKIGVLNNANEMAKHPTLGKFVKMSPTGTTFNITKPADTSSWFGTVTPEHDPNTPTQEEYNYIYGEIFGHPPISSTPNTPRATGPVHEGPDPDAGMPRTPMSPGTVNPDTMPEGSLRTNRRTGVTEVKVQGKWVRAR